MGAEIECHAVFGKANPICSQFLTTFELPDLPANSKTISRIRRLISRCDIVWLFFEGRLRGAVTFYGYTTAK